jgi:DNA-binding PucR family transcriptional regulator
VAATPSRVAATARRIDEAAGMLATRAMRLMEDDLDWFAAMPPQPRSQVGMLIQTGIRGFGRWLTTPAEGPTITADVFATAPRDLARLVTLEHTVQLVRVAVRVTEDAVDELAAPSYRDWLHLEVLRYSREIAFAVAMVYARAAEQRGAWDARLEALVVDAVARGEVSDSLLSRASALGWSQPPTVMVVAGPAPDGDPEPVLALVRRLGHDAEGDVLAGVHSARLVVVFGVSGSTSRVTDALLPAFADGPVVTGPPVTNLVEAATTMQDVFAALRVAAAWPGAPRPVAAADLLPERALAGDRRAVSALVAQVHGPVAADAALLTTADAFVASGGSIEATARELFVHANTVRYRLRRIADRCGLDITLGRDRYVLQTALAFGRLANGAAPE